MEKAYPLVSEAPGGRWRRSERNTEQSVERETPGRSAYDRESFARQQASQFVETIVLSVTDRAVEGVHWAGGHCDNEPATGAKKAAREPESELRRVQMLENFATDDGVGAFVRQWRIGVAIEVALQKPGRRQAPLRKLERGWLDVDTNEAHLRMRTADPFQQRAAPASEVDYDGSRRQALEFAHNQSPAVALRRAELICERVVAPQPLVLLGVAHFRPSPRRARI